MYQVRFVNTHGKSKSRVHPSSGYDQSVDETEMPSRVSGRDSYRRGGKNPVMSAFNEDMLPKQQKKATHRDGGVSSQLAHGAKGSVDPISPSQYSNSLVGKLTRMPRNRRGCMQSMHQRDPRLRGRNQSSRKDQCQAFQQWQSCAANHETLWIGT